ncbi:MAG: radical SAM family heme chaperone HemW [Ignavibacteriae bacterium]|nr:radical SAM family heme chaperone HemW [Ignavibacteriota bacterium]
MNKSGIYIHIPFCRRKCSYCDFYLVTNLSVIGKFTSNLRNEIALSSRFYQDVEFDSVFFGGGTPSLLSVDDLAAILKTIKDEYRISDSAEISIESNPEDFTEDNSKLPALRDIGFNRISLGVQSLIDDELKFLTREHDSDMAVRVTQRALKYFENLSADVIYSLPEQKLQSSGRTVDKLIELGVPHISAYTLIFESNTVLNKLRRKNITLPNNESLEAGFYYFITEKLLSAGYNHYEVSNYSLQGFESRHNMKYWDYADYIGFGPSAHSLFRGKRWNNVRNIILYNNLLKENRLTYENITMLTAAEKQNEFILCGLRAQGIHLLNFSKLFGKNFSEIFVNQTDRYIRNGFAEYTSGRFRLTEKGYLLADEITLAFLN